MRNEPKGRRVMADVPPGDQVYNLGEILVTIAAAGCASYVRAKQMDKFHWKHLTASIFEAVVCGSIAIGIASYMEWKDPRVMVGVSAAIGLIGANTISELILRFVMKRADIESVTTTTNNRVGTTTTTTTGPSGS